MIGKLTKGPKQNGHTSEMTSSHSHWFFSRTFFLTAINGNSQNDHTIIFATGKQAKTK
jgi:hypothetical protein